ncbi:helix-turn-helix transcriptional regulator [Celerinatantimonas sp. YJH-8]|uniref:helix-turn-helix transcriptional regulator n=1 Tax=Celerinatantimonas sp. YJH-8 TaxID=3228714 RepID=UPI0038BE98A7
MPKRSKKYIPGAKRYNVFREMVKANYGGLMQDVTERMLRDLFETMDEAAQYFGVNPSTLHRWRKSGHWPTMPLRLMLIMHRGYLPTTGDWAGCKIRKLNGTNPKQPPVDLLYIPGFREGFRPEDVRWYIMLKERWNRLEEKEKHEQKAAHEAAEKREHFTVIKGGKLWKRK